MPLTKSWIAKKFCQYPDDFVIRELLIGSLSDKETQAYTIVCKSKTVSTRAVAEQLKISISNAGNLLLRLYRFKLIQRRSQTDDSRLFYVWTKA